MCQSINQVTKRKLRNPIHNPTPEQMNQPDNCKCCGLKPIWLTKFERWNIVDEFCEDCEEEIEEDYLTCMLREKNERLKYKGLEATFCRHCDAYCEKALGSDHDCCGDCEDQEEGQNCRRCQTFVPDGEEHVAEGDCDAYCETCYDDLVQYCGIHLKCELERGEPNDDNEFYCPKCEED